MQILTVITFDGCALLFGCIHMFYRFANRAAKDWITVGWVITNILSAVASVFFLVVENVYRFHLAITQNMVNTGDGISITTLMFDGLILTVWVYLEWTTRHPRQDDFEEFEEDDEEFDSDSNAISVSPAYDIPGIPRQSTKKPGLVGRMVNAFKNEPQPKEASTQQSTSVPTASKSDADYEYLARQELILERQKQEHQRRIAEARARIEAEQRQSPLQQPVLETQANQNGKNGQ
jgi:hypothetical protein